MNGKDMYPMWFILAAIIQQQLILPMPYPTIPLVGYAELRCIEKKSTAAKAKSLNPLQQIYKRILE
jgi:hypothetical protein